MEVVEITLGFTRKQIDRLVEIGDTVRNAGYILTPEERICWAMEMLREAVEREQLAKRSSEMDEGRVMTARPKLVE